MPKHPKENINFLKRKRGFKEENIPDEKYAFPTSLEKQEPQVWRNGDAHQSCVLILRQALSLPRDPPSSMTNPWAGGDAPRGGRGGWRPTPITMLKLSRGEGERR